MEQQFIGEHLLPGQWGQFFILLAFISSLFACFSYFNAVRKENLNSALSQTWRMLARIGFIIQAFSVIAVFVILYYIISHHLFEYNYAYRHSSRGLKTKYLLACFWEGSEGSFLLWTFWHAVLGLFLIRWAKEWETRVMFTVSIVQAVLYTMVLGIYITDTIKIGSTPFSLLRNEMSWPILSQPNYLELLKDGNGLNVTLQNYWMVIHPPILFLGFALTLIPFAYAIAAMWKGDYKSWVKPALRWTLIGSGILGAGIMMGGAWAYESLNFGGYWAWDPVENASLVPWLVLIAGLHTLVIYKSTGRSLKITLIFFILSYILIWYSTFLTRTGVLGETSVHSFTGEGKALYWHLIIAMAIYVVLSLGFIFKSWKKMPRVAGEEELDTREFWILIGAIVLLLASIHIIASTSLPVWSGLYKSLTGIDIAPPIDPVEYYNNIQVWGAIFVALLTGAIQLLKYKKTQMRQAGRALLLIALISLGITIIFVIAQQIAHKQYMVFTFSIFFALLGNIYFLVTHQKLKLLKAGGSITHIGFAIMLLGILLSGYKKRVISLDKSSAMQNWNFGKKTFEENVKESRENILIFRNTKVPMSNYLVTYLGDSLVNNDPPITYYKVRYDRMNPETGDVEESFHLYPEAYVNPKGQDGISANPDAKHYWTHDVFTYITSISKPGTDTSDYRTFKVRVGDSIFIANAYLTFDGLENSTSSIDGEIAVGAKVTAYNAAGKLGEAKPLYIIKESEAIGLEDTLRDIGVNVRFQRILPDENAIELGVKQRAQQDDWIVMKAIIFPYINLLWAGIVIMILGFFISWWARRK